MILQQLYCDADRILGTSVTPPMYDVKPVRWLIRLSSEGALEQIQSLPGRRGTDRTIPYVGRAGKVLRPVLLADTVEYALGLSDDDKRVGEKHAAFKQLIGSCAIDTKDPLVAVVDAFLKTWEPSSANKPDNMTDGDIALFIVGNDDPTESQAVRDFWARSARGDAVEPRGEAAFQCLVTGAFGPVDKCLSGMIKGIPDGQPAGTAIVSANSVAFESYGLERAETAPIGRSAAETFTKALNFLIAGERTHLRVGRLVYVFWAHDPGAAAEYLSFLSDPDASEVKDLLASYRTGCPSALAAEAPFYALALSASGGRAVVRDWISTTVGRVHNNLAEWFGAQEIVGLQGTPDKYYGMFPLAAGLYRDAYKEITAQTGQAIMACALHGAPLPMSLLQLAVNRNRAEQRVTRNRAALIKAVLITQKEIPMPEPGLDTSNTSAAYACGRLLAILEVVQRAAVGRVNTTLTDRYFGAASTSPATVFGVLMTQANKAHFPKIRKTRPATHHALQSRIAELVDQAKLTEFPSTLTLRQQGVFALGYYQQRAADQGAIKEANERKNRGATIDETAMAEIDTDTKE